MSAAEVDETYRKNGSDPRTRLGENDRRAIRRERDVRDLTRGLVEHGPGWKLETPAAVRGPDDRQRATVWCPRRVEHALDDLARRTARERRTRERAIRQPQGHVSRRRQGQEAGAGQLERTRLRAADARREHFGREPMPRRAVDHCLTVRREPG
jgi:hypothetical protein